MDDSNNVSSEAKFLVHSYYGRRPELSVYNERVQTDTNASGNSVEYDAAQNTLTIQLTNGVQLILLAANQFVWLGFLIISQVTPC